MRRARRGDELRVLAYLTECARPVPVDELIRSFPDRSHAIVGVIANLEMDGLVEVAQGDGSKVVSITTDGRALRKRV